MSAPLFPDPHESRTPSARSEARLEALRNEALATGSVHSPGVRPAGSPMPLASPETGYYGTPLLKEPQWTWQVPLYFFVGGAAGAAALLAEIAYLTGADPELIQDARTVAAAGGMLSPALLVADLGMPSRFLNMLRVFKLRSPMSVGVYIVTGFGNAAVAAKFAELAGKRLPNAIFRGVESGAGLVAGLLGMGMATYTGVLIGATSIPVWNEHVKTLPVHFAMSGMASAVSALELMGHTRSPAVNLMGITASTIETLQGAVIEANRRPVTKPLKRGASGWIVRAGGLLSGPLPLVLRVASLFAGKENAPKLRRIAAVSSLTGSILTRYGWMQAGKASARDFRLPLEIGSGQSPDQMSSPLDMQSQPERIAG